MQLQHPASLSLRCPTPPLAGLRRQVNPNDLNLVAEVSLKEPRLFVSHAPPRQGKDGKRMRILAIDCGIKANIIRSLCARDIEVKLACIVTSANPFSESCTRFGRAKF